MEISEDYLSVGDYDYLTYTLRSPDGDAWNSVLEMSSSPEAVVSLDRVELSGAVARLWLTGLAAGTTTVTVKFKTARGVERVVTRTVNVSA